jgi:diguanylate cyclase (GGDEF)-like protein
MAGDSRTTTQPYDPQSLLNAQPIVVTLIDPATFRIQYENQSAVSRFGPCSTATCYEKISGAAAPCSFCRMWETAETGRSLSAEVPRPNGDCWLFQWSKAESLDGDPRIIETITDITETKKQQQHVQLLNRQLEAINQQLLQHNRQLQERSIRDGLTGLYNHSYFCETLTRTFAQAKRTGSPLSLLFLDLDNFKLVNDEFGHGMGDQVLQAVGRLLAPAQGATVESPLIRSSDLAARYGGEEFVLLLTDTPLEGALVIAERVRQRIGKLTEQADCAHLATLGIRISCSLGVASFPRHVATPPELIAAADQAAYRAKAAGKNRVAAYRG